MTFKLVVADPKTGKSYKIETEDNSLVGTKIGETFSGESLGLAGYELEVTGGSDKTGTPMRKDVQGSTTRRILLSEGTGFHTDRNGERRKKRVFGNKIGADIVQINLKVVKEGSQPIDKLIAPAAAEGEEKKEGDAAPAEGEAPAEPAKEEAAPIEEKPAEEAKPEEPKAEEKKEEKPAEEPAKEEEKKEDAPAEEPKEEEKPVEEKKE
jgi:small subunit ribosomal protein S6e